MKTYTEEMGLEAMYERIKLSEVPLCPSAIRRLRATMEYMVYKGVPHTTDCYAFTPLYTRRDWRGIADWSKTRFTDFPYIIMFASGNCYRQL